MICPICLEEDERIVNEGDACPECMDFQVEQDALDAHYREQEKRTMEEID